MTNPQPLTPDTKRSGKKTQPPRYKPGQEFGLATIERYAGRYARPGQAETMHQYLMVCECGEHFEADQKRLSTVKQKDIAMSCGCAIGARRSIPPVLINHHWGYNPRESLGV